MAYISTFSKSNRIRRILIHSFLALIIIDYFLGFMPLLVGFHPQYLSLQQMPSIEQINSYRDYIHKRNETLAKKNLRNILTTITFARPLSVEEYVVFSETYNIEIPSNVGGPTCRWLQYDGLRVTGGIYAGDGATLEEMEEEAERKAEDCHAEFLGVTAVECYIDSKYLLKAMQDFATYLIDTSRDAYFKAYFTGFLYPRESLRNFTIVYKSPGSTFNMDVVWYLEDVGYGGYNYIVEANEACNPRWGGGQYYVA